MTTPTPADELAAAIETAKTIPAVAHQHVRLSIPTATRLLALLRAGEELREAIPLLPFGPKYEHLWRAKAAYDAARSGT